MESSRWERMHLWDRFFTRPFGHVSICIANAWPCGNGFMDMHCKVYFTRFLIIKPCYSRYTTTMIRGESWSLLSIRSIYGQTLLITLQKWVWEETARHILLSFHPPNRKFKTKKTKQFLRKHIHLFLIMSVVRSEKNCILPHTKFIAIK